MFFGVVYREGFKLEQANFNTKQEAFDFATKLLSSYDDIYDEDDIVIFEGTNIFFNVTREVLVTVTENCEE